MITDSSDDEAFLCGTIDARPRVGIIYEDSVMGLKAKLTLDRLGRRMNLGGDPFDVRLWSFALLADEDHRRTAAHEAAEFDIVIFSVRNCGKLPASIEDWLAEWLRHRAQRPCALTVFVDEQTRHVEKMALVDYLNTLARVGGLDLIVPFQEKARVAGEAVMSEFDAGPTRLSPPWDEFLTQQKSYPGWGLTNKDNSDF